MPNDNYFSYLPTIPYNTFDGSHKYKVVTDIFKRARATLEARTDKTIYYNYRVQDGQKPEHVSYNYYDSPKYHWVILMMNEIRDPQWCWPLGSHALERFVVNKYGSAQTAATQIKHYETKELRSSTDDDTFSKNDIVLRSGMVVPSDFTFSYTGSVAGVSSGTQAFTSSQCVKTVYALDYEVSQNDNRSDIVLLRRNLLQEFVESFETLVTTRR